MGQESDDSVKGFGISRKLAVAGTVVGSFASVWHLWAYAFATAFYDYFGVSLDDVGQSGLPLFRTLLVVPLMLVVASILAVLPLAAYLGIECASYWPLFWIIGLSICVPIFVFGLWTDSVEVLYIVMMLLAAGSFGMVAHRRRRDAVQNAEDGRGEMLQRKPTIALRASLAAAAMIMVPLVVFNVPLGSATARWFSQTGTLPWSAQVVGIQVRCVSMIWQHGKGQVWMLPDGSEWETPGYVYYLGRQGSRAVIVDPATNATMQLDVTEAAFVPVPSGEPCRKL